MLGLGQDHVASATAHSIVARQLAVTVSYALLIIFAEHSPDSVLGSALRWWVNESMPWVQTVLFFEPAPSLENAEKISVRILAYRHVLVGSLCFALYSIVISRPHWSTWAGALSARLVRAKRSRAEFERLCEIGFHRMILGAIGATVLAIYLEPAQAPSVVWSASSDWAILRAPLLIGVATAFALLAVTLHAGQRIRH